MVMFPLGQRGCALNNVVHFLYSNPVKIASNVSLILYLFVLNLKMWSCSLGPRLYSSPMALKLGGSPKLPTELLEIEIPRPYILPESDSICLHPFCFVLFFLSFSKAFADNGQSWEPLMCLPSS